MKQVSFICLFLFLLDLPIIKASSLVCREQYGDSLSYPDDSAIVFINSDFYLQLPEGYLSNLAAYPIKFYAEKTSDEKANITLIPSQRIYGNHLKKEEIYLHIIPNIFLIGNSIYKYRFPMFFLQPCMDSVNKLGGVPGSGFSFKILNIHVVNSSLQNDMIMDKRPSFALGTIIYTYLKFNALKAKEEMLLNATMAIDAASYTEGKTRKEEAISGHIEKRILFKNEQFI